MYLVYGQRHRFKRHGRVIVGRQAVDRTRMTVELSVQSLKLGEIIGGVSGGHPERLVNDSASDRSVVDKIGHDEGSSDVVHGASSSYGNMQAEKPFIRPSLLVR